MAKFIICSICLGSGMTRRTPTEKNKTRGRKVTCWNCKGEGLVEVIPVHPGA